jgi:hypothetical protein
VYRVAAGYGLVGWLLIQLTVTVFSTLGVPRWATQFVVVLILAGFPIALVMAWAFDVGPGGVKVTPDPTAGADCPAAFSARRQNIFALALFGLTISVSAGYFLLGRSSARALDKSIAVLPFTNFSNEKALQLDPLFVLSRFEQLLAKHGSVR